MRKIATLIVFVAATTMALSACTPTSASKVAKAPVVTQQVATSSPLRQLGTVFETTPVPAGLVGTWTAVRVMGVPTRTFRPATLTLKKLVYPKSPGFMNPINGTADDTCNKMDFAAAFSSGSQVDVSQGFIATARCSWKVPAFTRMLITAHSWDIKATMVLHHYEVLTIYDAQHKVIGVFQHKV